MRNLKKGGSFGWIVQLFRDSPQTVDDTNAFTPLCTFNRQLSFSDSIFLRLLLCRLDLISTVLLI